MSDCHFCGKSPVEGETWKLVAGKVFSGIHEESAVCPNCVPKLRINKNDVELTEIWNSLNTSERVGIHFGMFPSRLGELTKEDSVALMEIEATLRA